MMEKLLFLVHRLPYPPNKGEKSRAYHMLRYLAERYQVYLGTFVDDPADEPHVATVRGMCTELHVGRIHPRSGRIKSLRGLLTGEALTLPYYRNAAMQEWVLRTVREQGIKTVVVFCSSMAQYALPLLENDPALRLLVDFVDVDSAKWTHYGERHAWPMSWLYRREGKRLLDFERQVAERAEASFFVTDAEVSLFRKLTPGCDATVEAMGCGVNADFFSPDQDVESPYSAAELPIVFTGVMDYWPNVDAVTWFAQEMLPAIRAKHPAARFYIVGMKPAPAVSALAADDVVVTGMVADVRPYIKYAAAVVAPLRVARGVQTKVLESMAMARPVVVAKSSADVIDAQAGRDFLVADDVQSYIDGVVRLLDDPGLASRIGQAARMRVMTDYSWQAHLQRLAPHLQGQPGAKTRRMNAATGQN